MAAKRPSYPSIRARQRNLLEYLYSTNQSYRQGARKLGVTPRELERFVQTKSPSLRQQFNRSPVIRELYAKGERKSLRAEARKQGERLERVRIEPGFRVAAREVPVLETAATERLVSAQERIAFLYTRQTYDTQVWAQYIASRNLPRSIKAIKLLYRNGRLTNDEYDTIISAWKIIYGIEDARAA